MFEQIHFGAIALTPQQVSFDKAAKRVYISTHQYIARRGMQVDQLTVSLMVSVLSILSGVWWLGRKIDDLATKDDIRRFLNRGSTISWRETRSQRLRKSLMPSNITRYYPPPENMF